MQINHKQQRFTQNHGH